MLRNTKGHVIVSKANRSIVVPRLGDTINMFPDAHALTHLNTEFLVVPHGLRETIMLRHLGYKLPNPMLCYYDWKGGTPFSVQRATCDLMTTAARAYVLNSMGTGKTKAALWAWDYLHGNSMCGKMLVVCTLSTMNFTWARECFATLPHRKAVVLHGSKARRLERLRDSDADIFIINHDGVKTIAAELLLRTDIDVLCLDELAVYRNNSERSKAMRKFAERFKVVWGMTGRPMPNAPTDVWAQAKIVTPNTVPKFFRQAEEMLMLKINQFTLKPKPDAVEKAMRMLQPSVRFSLDAVVELPETVSRTIDIPLTAEQQKVYATLAREFHAQIQGKTINAVNAAVAMGKLLQVSGGWVYAGGSDSVAVDATPRLQALKDLVMEAERKVLIFMPYRHALAGVSSFLIGSDPLNPDVEHEIVHGGVHNRDEIFNLFQNTSKYKALLAHPQCLAHGLTLTAADTVIWYMPIMSLDIYEQANARITRVGQKHRQQIFHLQSTPVEKKIYTMLRGKQRLQDALLDLLGEATTFKG